MISYVLFTDVGLQEAVSEWNQVTGSDDVGKTVPAYTVYLVNKY